MRSIKTISPIGKYIKTPPLMKAQTKCQVVSEKVLVIIQRVGDEAEFEPALENLQAQVIFP